MPGFISCRFRNYTGCVGDLLVIVEFAPAETLTAWANHPEYLDSGNEAAVLSL
jgi:hypothetical protein